jgi:hypothetical protein
LLLLTAIVVSTGFDSIKDELLLGSKGKTDYEIILPENGNETLDRAAQLIKDAFAANGIDIPVVKESRDDKSKPGIYLGDTEFARSSGIEPSRFSDWDYLFRVAGSDLIITGSNSSHRQGVVKGVCDFLREYAGGRFLYPGLTGIEFLSAPEISVPANLDLSVVPWLKFNDTYDMYPGKWLYSIANNHFPAGFELQGHMWEKAVPYEDYYHTHPEYFALVNGKRFDRDGKSQYCISNPQVMDLILQYLIKGADLGNEIVVLAQPDAFRNCECEECRKFYGTGDDWDEKVWLFHREIAERLQEERPGVEVMMASYQATTHPPKTFKRFPDNAMVLLSHTYVEALAEWEGYEIPGGFVGYLQNFGSYFFTNYLPKRTPEWLEAQARRLHDMNVLGLRPDGTIYGYGLEGPAYYAWGRMFDDPVINTAEELLEEFYNAAFGEAAGPMRRFYGILHAGLKYFCDWLSPRSPTHFRQGLDRKPTGIDDQLDWVRASTAQFGSRGMHRGISAPEQVLNILYTPGMISGMEQELAQAEAMDNPDKVRLRLALVRMELEYLKHAATVNNLYQAYRISPDEHTLDRLLEGIDDWNALLDTFYDENGRMKHIPGWPELRPFRNTGRAGLGLIQARWWSKKDVKDNPFAWDTEAIRKQGVLP